MCETKKIRVRMYKRGLGDCFLLTFFGSDDNADPLAHMLIDCGLDWSTHDGAAKIREVAADVFTTTVGKLDVLVATHEHWDHVSGFARAETQFDQMDIDNVWLAWTEDPEDDLARSLDNERNMTFSALAMAAGQLKENGMTSVGQRLALEGQGMAVDRVLSFFGTEMLGAYKFSKNSDKAMDFVQKKKKDGEYFSPGGSPVELDCIPGVRFYVLGPPRDTDALKRMNPSEHDPETYEIGSRINARRTFVAAMQNLEQRMGYEETNELLREEDLKRLETYPFSKKGRIQGGSTGARNAYGEAYAEDAEDWRRIDLDWLTTSSSLALQLDNAVNNTSLVLAIELVESGKVLLFAADAQVGNWLSWGECRWTVKEGDSTREVDAEDLLEKTVLYKVGHHGSHNATLRDRGLELMTSRDLVAMIPVDRDFARDVKGWSMPHDPLLKNLKKKCRRRILRADSDWPKPRSRKPSELSPESWRDFQQAVSQTELFVDFYVR